MRFLLILLLLTGCACTYKARQERMVTMVSRSYYAGCMATGQYTDLMLQLRCYNASRQFTREVEKELEAK